MQQIKSSGSHPYFLVQLQQKFCMKKEILVGNIGMEANEESIREMFSATVSPVLGVSIPLDPKTGRNRGYALVEMNNDLDAEQAIRDLSGTLVEGRAMSFCLVEQAPVERKWYNFGRK